MSATTDTDTPTTPAQLLIDLGELHIRTLMSPLPKMPAAMGWQATAGTMAAGFARALHALNEIDPEKAAEITDWFQGPFEEGPDPEEHTDWLERHVAQGPELLEQWIADGQRRASETAARQDGAPLPTPDETAPADSSPHVYMDAVQDSVAWAYALTKAGQMTEALEHVEAMERLLAVYRRAVGA